MEQLHFDAHVNLVIGGKLAHIRTYLVAKKILFYNIELNHEYTPFSGKKINPTSNWSPNNQMLGHHQKLQKMLYMRSDR